MPPQWAAEWDNRYSNNHCPLFHILFRRFSLSLVFFLFFFFQISFFFFFFGPVPICDEWLAAHSIASSIEEFVHKRNCRDMKNIHRLNKWVPRALRVCCVVTRRGGSGHSKILFCHKFISSCFFFFLVFSDDEYSAEE